MTLYFIVFFILASLALLSLDKANDKYVKLNSVIAFFILAIISGFRSSDTGADYGSYMHIFYDFKSVFNGGIVQVLEGEYFFEIGFALLVSILAGITSDHIVFFLWISLLTSLLMFIVLNKLTVFPLLSILIFFSYDFFTNYMVAIRFGIASALGLFVLFYLSQKKYHLAFVFILFSMTIHTAAIGLFLPFLLSFYKFKRIYILFVVAVALLVGYAGLGELVVINFLDSWVPRADSAVVYINDEKFGNSLGYLGFINIKYLLLSLIVYVFWNKLKKQVSCFNMIVVFLLSATAIRIGFHDLGFITGRISALLGIVEIVLVPILFMLVFKTKLIAFFGVVLYAFFNLIFLLYIRGFSEYSTVFS